MENMMHSYSKYAAVQFSSLESMSIFCLRNVFTDVCTKLPCYSEDELSIVKSLNKETDHPPPLDFKILIYILNCTSLFSHASNAFMEIVPRML